MKTKAFKRNIKKLKAFGASKEVLIDLVNEVFSDKKEKKELAKDCFLKVLSLKKQFSKIEAIKMLREKNKEISLLEAKILIEEIEKEKKLK